MAETKALHQSKLIEEVAGKQATLISGTNIKTVNNNDIVGSGNISVGDMTKAIYDTTNNGVVDNAELVNGLSVLTAVPSGAIFTDTVYTHPTTDGSLHVPATGTTNSGKVLTAGATAGSLSWTTVSGGSSTLDGLTDVIITSAISGQTISWNGTTWVNATPSSGVTDHTLLTNIGTNTHAQIDTALTRLANTSGTNTGDQDLSGYSLTTHNHTVDGLSNVVITANSDKELLAWDSVSSKWINQTPAEALLATSTHNHTGVYEPVIPTKNSGFNLNTGTTIGTLATGNHTHTGVYEPADGTILKSASIGTTVQGYNANTTTAGNTFNGANQLVKLNATGQLPAIDGSLLTGITSGGGGSINYGLLNTQINQLGGSF